MSEKSNIKNMNLKIRNFLIYRISMDFHKESIKRKVSNKYLLSPKENLLTKEIMTLGFIPNHDRYNKF